MHRRKATGVTLLCSYFNWAGSLADASAPSVYQSPSGVHLCKGTRATLSVLFFQCSVSCFGAAPPSAAVMPSQPTMPQILEFHTVCVVCL